MSFYLSNQMHNYINTNNKSDYIPQQHYSFTNNYSYNSKIHKNFNAFHLIKMIQNDSILDLN